MVVNPGKIQGINLDKTVWYNEQAVGYWQSVN